MIGSSELKKMTNKQLYNLFNSIIKIFHRRIKGGNSRGLEMRLYNVLLDRQEHVSVQRAYTHEERLRKLAALTELEFLRYRNVGVGVLGQAREELKKLGLTFKEE